MPVSRWWVHERVLDRLMPLLKKKLDEKQVEIRGDRKAAAAAEGIVPATEEDWEQNIWITFCL